MSWNIFAKAFIFKLDRREGEPNCIHVVWLEKKAAVMKIKDFAPNDTCKSKSDSYTRQQFKIILKEI